MSTKSPDLQLLNRMHKIDIASDALKKLNARKDALEMRRRTKCNNVELMVVDNSISYYSKVLLGIK